MESLLSFEIDIDLIPTCIAIYKKDGDDFIFVDFNKNAEKIEAISKKDILGCKLTDIYPNIKKFGLFDVLLRVEQSGKSETFDTIFYRDNGISGYRKNEVIKLPNGNIATFFTDTTDEKNLEILLKEQKKYVSRSNARFKNYINSRL